MSLVCVDFSKGRAWIFTSLLIVATLHASVCKALSEGQVAELANAKEILATHQEPARMIAFLDKPVYGRGWVRPAPENLMIGWLGHWIWRNLDEQEERYRAEERTKFKPDPYAVKQEEFQDPVVFAKSRAVARFTSVFGLSNVRSVSEVSSKDGGAMEAMRAKATAEFIIDFKTSDWGLMKADPDSWAIFYRATGRIARLSDGNVFETFSCREKAVKGLSLKQLTDDGAGVLKSKFQEMAESCGDEMMDEMIAAWQKKAK